MPSLIMLTSIRIIYISLLRTICSGSNSKKNIRRNSLARSTIWTAQFMPLRKLGCTHLPSTPWAARHPIWRSKSSTNPSKETSKTRQLCHFCSSLRQESPMRLSPSGTLSTCPTRAFPKSKSSFKKISTCGNSYTTVQSLTHHPLSTIINIWDH